jgi:hypothetical protein
MSDKPLSIELLALKAAFDRACKMAGGGVRMAAALGVSEPTITRWKRDNHPDAIPAELFCKIDAAAGYPCMLEAIAAMAGYLIRRDEIQHADMPLCSLAGQAAVDAGKFVFAVTTADADDVITRRELACIEAEGRSAVADITRGMEAARGKCFGASGVKLAAAE